MRNIPAPLVQQKVCFYIIHFFCYLRGSSVTVITTPPPQSLSHRSTWRGQVKNPSDPPTLTSGAVPVLHSGPVWGLREVIKSDYYNDLITVRLWSCKQACWRVKLLFMWTNNNISQRCYCRDDVFPLINEKSYGGMLISPSTTTGTIVTKSTILKLTSIIWGIFLNHACGETTYSSAENRVPGICLWKNNIIQPIVRGKHQTEWVFFLFLGVHLCLPPLQKGTRPQGPGCGGVIFLVMQNNNRQKKMTAGMYE